MLSAIHLKIIVDYQSSAAMSNKRFKYVTFSQKNINLQLLSVTNIKLHSCFFNHYIIKLHSIVIKSTAFKNYSIKRVPAVMI